MRKPCCRQPYQRARVMLLLLLSLAPASLAAQQAAPPAARTAPAGTAEDVVRALYRVVTFDAGKDVDWEQVRALFIPEAVIVLRASRTSMNVLNRNTFVDDFVRFIRDAKLEDQAFEETVVAIKTQETGDVARSTVHYAARIPSRDRPAQHGIDVFLLMKTDNQWRIVSIVNEIVRPGVDIPEELRK
jgi:Putative lumazine-binding